MISALSSILMLEYWTSPMVQWVKNLPAMQEIQADTGFEPWVKKVPLEEEMAPSPVSLPKKSHEQKSLLTNVHGVASVGHN